jgi:hypothetical protein
VIKDREKERGDRKIEGGNFGTNTYRKKISAKLIPGPTKK